MLLQYAFTCATLILLLTFAFTYQTVRNQELIDSRFELAAFLFDAEGKSTQDFTREIDTIDEFLEAFEDVTSAYYDLPDSSSGTFMHFTNGRNNSTPIAPILELSIYEGFYDSSSRSKILTKSFDILEENPLGPFSDPDSFINVSESCQPKQDLDNLDYIPCRASKIAELFDRLINVKLTFSIYSFVRRKDGSPHPRVWFAKFLFELSGHNSVMIMKVSLDSVEKHNPERLPVMISCALLSLVTIGFLIRIRTFPLFSIPIRQIFCSQKGVREINNLISVNSGAQEGGWRWSGFLLDVFILSFCITSLVSQFKPRTNSSLEQAVTILLGFSTLINCARLVSILKLFPNRYVVVNGFVTAARQLSLYAVAVFPVLFGYSICGNVVFGAYEGYFGSLPRSIVSLICATFGDNLIDTFLVMDQSSYIVQLIFSRVFIMTFLLFFICNVLSIAHSIIQDSFTYAVRMHSADCRKANGEDQSSSSISTEEINEILTRLRG